MSETELKVWNWPDWVPALISRDIESFYEYHRHYEGWLESMIRNNAPALGAYGQWPALGKPYPTPCREGRFVFAWNNIGRVVHSDGTFSYVSFDRDSLAAIAPKGQEKEIEG